MENHSDLVVRDRRGLPVVAVEVKNRQGLSSEVAAQLRRNMLAHGLLGPVSYFVLVSQDRGYVWPGEAAGGLDAPPLLEFPMDHVVERYLPGARANGRLRGSELEFVVLQWLADLTHARNDVSAEPERSLAQVGFLDAMRGGAVEAPALA